MTASLRYLFPAPNVISEQFSGEMIAIDFSSGTYYRLNNEATHLAAMFNHLVVTPATLGQLMDVDPGRYHMLTELISMMKTADLIAESPVSECEATPVEAIHAWLSETNLDKSRMDTYTDMQFLLKLDDIFTVDSLGWPVSHG